MAEAHSAVSIGHKATGVKLNLSDDGLKLDLSFTIPLRWSIIRIRLQRQAERLRNAIVDGTYPFGPMAMGIVVVGVTLFVMVVDREHWIRQGWLGTLVWNIGHWFPWVSSLPLMYRVAWLTMWAAFIGFLLLAALQRVLLRMLFSYQAFLYASRGNVPLSVKLWGFAVKLLSGRKPMTYGFSSTLPSRPVPSLEATTTRWLETVKPIQSEEEYKKSVDMVKSFLTHEGPRLQRYLHLKHLVSSNFVADWWEKYCYHKGRSSIMINSNYYVLDGAYKLPTTLRNARAGQLVHNMLEYNVLVEREQIPPMLIKGMVPLCMAQHVRMFATTRIPGRDCDHIKHFAYSDTKHVAVLCRGHYFKVDVLRKDGTVLTARELETLFDFITEEVERLGACDSEEGALAVLTSDNRTKWAESRETYFAEGLNRASLRVIEAAIMVVVLDDSSPSTMTDLGRALIAGSGADRWFDKSITCVAFANGRIGLNCEHSWADAPVIAHMIEWCMMTGDLVDGVYQDDGHTREARSGTTPPLLPARVLFDFPQGLRKHIREAQVRATAAVEDLDLSVSFFEEYGKGFIKTVGVSPDAYLQMALQITYFRNMERFPLTYESAMARLFKQGRTETIRTVSEQSCAFVRAFLDGETDAATKLKLLRDACNRHTDYTRDAMTGKGIDRHLFALYIVSAGKDIDSPFLKAALSEPWRLSTSQQPQQQTDRWDLRDPATHKRLGAGGGFGPVCDDGYGVSYMVAGENAVFFHVSSKKQCADTSSTEFMRLLQDTMRSMKTTFAPLAKKPKKA